MSKENILIVMALESQSEGLIEQLNFPVLYCGVGKINVTYALTFYLTKRQMQHKPIK
jgi:hypothetical protein